VDTELRNSVIAPDEELVVQGNRVWLYAPSGGGAIRIIDQDGSGFGRANDGPQPQHAVQARGNGALTVGVVGRYAGAMKSICIIACIITC
jgi:hypothetical protein